MGKRPLTPSYVIFYILFLPDSWQIVIGIIAAVLITPYIVPPHMGQVGRAALYVMIATIGYAASRIIARRITQGLKKLILGDKIR